MKSSQNKNPRGISIVIALIMIMVMMFFTVGVTQITSTALREAQNWNNSTQAYYAAKSALEEGLYEYTQNKKLSGETSKDSKRQVVGISDANPPEIATGKNNTKKYYSYPVPGTGNAGINCDPLNPVDNFDTWKKYIDEAFPKNDADGSSTNPNNNPADGSSTDTTSIYGSGAEDAPCNWNKISYGNPGIEIPLYGLEEKDEKITFEDFILRVRAPCKKNNTDESGTMCETLNRYDLNSIGNPISPENVMMEWTFEGKCTDGDCYLIPPDVLPVYLYSNITAQIINWGKNTNELYYRIFNITDLSKPSKNIQGMKKGSSLPVYLDQFLNNNIASDLILKLSVNQPLTPLLTPGETLPPYIPHLEYQILYNRKKSDGTNPPITGSPTVMAEGFAGGYKRTLKATFFQNTGMFKAVMN